MKRLIIFVLLFLILQTINNRCYSDTYTSENFHVRCNTADAKLYSDHLEDNRTNLSLDWFGVPLKSWRTSKIPVSIFVNTNSGGGQTAFAINDINHLAQTSMIIEGSKAALINDVIPHEVFHLVLAANLGYHLPRWLDEGLCCSVESRRLKIHNTILTKPGTRFYSQSFLTTTKDYPSDILLFYAQSASQVEFLLQSTPRNTIVTALRNRDFDSLLVDQDSWLSWLRAGSPRNPDYFNNQVIVLSPWDGSRWGSCSTGTCESPTPRPASQQTTECQAYIDLILRWKAYSDKQAAKIKSLESQIKSLESQIADLQAKNTPDPNKDLQSKIEDLNSQIADLNSQVSDLQSQIKDLESQIADLQSKLKDKDSSILELTNQIKTLESKSKDYDDLTIQITSLQDQLKTGKPYYIYLCSDDSDPNCYNEVIRIRTLVKFDIRIIKLHGTNVSRDNLPRLYLFPSAKSYVGAADVLTALETLDKIPNLPQSK